MVCGGLVNRLAGKRKEGFRFVSVSGLYSVKNTTGSRAHTGLLSGILRMTLGVSLHTEDRRFDIRQVIHPLDSLMLIYFITGILKKQSFFSMAKLESP
jgi:uncharacterized membrane protein affecting hemolysin expression